MTRRSLWTASFLTITLTALGMELWAANDRSSDTQPWTSLIVHNIPAALTMAAIGVLVTWLPSHFSHEYAKEGENVTGELDPTVEHPHEPLTSRALVVAVVGAVLALLVAFGVPISDDQRQAVLGVVLVVAPLVLAWWARNHVYSPATVSRLLAARDVRSDRQQGSKRETGAPDPGIGTS